MSVIAALWLASVLVPLVKTAHDSLPQALAAKRSSSLLQEANVQRYLTNRNDSQLRAVPFLELPYPNPDRLAGLLNSTIIQKILPANLQQPLQPVGVKQDAGAFSVGGAVRTVPACGCEFWGSYGAQGDGAVGELSLSFDPEKKWLRRSRTVLIKVSGYPSVAGRIEVIQGDSTQVLRFDKDPREFWVERYVSVRPGAFVIRVIDSSTSSWLAVSAPVIAGRLDPLVSTLLESFGSFLSLALAIIGALMLGTVRPRADEALTSCALMNRL
jgi:hypothetical protein